MAEVFILLGGNLGDKLKIFKDTRKLLAERIGFCLKWSSVYATEPWGFDSELFWNQVVVVETLLSPHEVLTQTQSIEKTVGRIKTSVDYEARPMDLDLLFYDDLLVDIPDLILPHPRMAERRFVLVPLNEISPDKIHPILGISIAEMLRSCPDRLTVERLS